jgi:hypothetical protein
MSKRLTLARGTSLTICWRDTHNQHPSERVSLVTAPEFPTITTRRNGTVWPSGSGIIDDTSHTLAHACLALARVKHVRRVQRNQETLFGSLEERRPVDQGRSAGDEEEGLRWDRDQPLCARRKSWHSLLVSRSPCVITRQGVARALGTMARHGMNMTAARGTNPRTGTIIHPPWVYNGCDSNRPRCTACRRCSTHA